MAGRVLHVSQSVNTGVAHCVGDWVRTQERHGWDVVVACPGGTLSERCADEGAAIERWRAVRSPGPSLGRELVELRSIIRAVDPDVVHLHSAKAGLAGRLLLRGSRPTVFSPHAWSYLAVGGSLREATLRWETFAVRWTATIACVSQSEMDRGIRDGIRGRYVVLPNQVDLDDYREILAEPRQTSRTRLGVTHDGPLAVCVARLAPQKGQDLLLQAWPDVVASLPDSMLVLIGDGPARSTLEEAAGKAPNVRLVGAQNRQTSLRWMNAADAVVSPSRWEGMSLVPLEARALGVPVVATDVDGIREAFPDQVGVRIVPVGSLSQLTTGILEAFRGAVPTVPHPSGPGGSSAEGLVELYSRLTAHGRRT